MTAPPLSEKEARSIIGCPIARTVWIDPDLVLDLTQPVFEGDMEAQRKEHSYRE